MRERNHHSDDSGANYNMLLCSGFPTKKFQRGSSPCISERQFTYISYIAKEGEVGISINTVNHLLQLFDYLHWIYSHEIIPSFPYCMLKHQRFCLCFNSRQFSLCCFQVISLLFLFFQNLCQLEMHYLYYLEMYYKSHVFAWYLRSKFIVTSIVLTKVHAELVCSVSASLGVAFYVRKENEGEWFTRKGNYTGKPFMASKNNSRRISEKPVFLQGNGKQIQPIPPILV